MRMTQGERAARDEALFLGIDVGTSRAKATVVDARGVLRATASCRNEVSRPHPGWAEQDADAVWWASVVRLCRELPSEALAHISGVGVSALGPCLLACDGEGHPLRPAILYGIDSRARDQIAKLEDRLGQEAILERAGSPLTTQAVGPKLAWLREQEPGVWLRTSMVFTASSYLAFRLTGEYALDHHTASQWAPLYELGTNQWARDWWQLIAAGLPPPPLLWPGERLGAVGAEAAAATGLPQGIPVAAGTGDSWAEAYGAGVRDPGQTMLVYGTTMFLSEVSTTAQPHPSLWMTAGFGPGRRNLDAGLAAAGALFDWLAGVTGVPVSRLLDEAAAIPAGSGGLLALPYFAGERTPLFDPMARGMFAGLRLEHGRGHLARALVESIAFAVRHNLETMAEAGATLRELNASGRATAGSLLPQVVSDVLGREQTLPGAREGGAYGSAFLAAMAAGHAESADAWTRPMARVEPDLGLSDCYDELYRLYRETSAATLPLSHRLSAFAAVSGGPGAATVDRGHFPVRG
jgi:xylulokinase